MQSNPKNDLSVFSIMLRKEKKGARKEKKEKIKKRRERKEKKDRNRKEREKKKEREKVCYPTAILSGLSKAILAFKSHRASLSISIQVNHFKGEGMGKGGRGKHFDTGIPQDISS